MNLSQIESSSAHYVQGLKDQKYAFFVNLDNLNLIYY